MEECIVPRSITIELTDRQAKRIDQVAAFYGKTPKEIVARVVRIGLSNFQPDNEDVIRKLANYIDPSVPK
jgi:hypothetical protein